MLAGACGMTTVERTEQATAWELRTAWAKSRPVVGSKEDALRELDQVGNDVEAGDA
jgi:hypothetical protein